MIKDKGVIGKKKLFLNFFNYLSATPLKRTRDPPGGRDPQVGNHCSKAQWQMSILHENLS